MSDIFKTLSKKQIREVLGAFGRQINKRCLNTNEFENAIHNYDNLKFIKDKIDNTHRFHLDNIDITIKDPDDIQIMRIDILNKIIYILETLNNMGYKHNDSNFIIDRRGNLKIIKLDNITQMDFDSLVDDISDIVFDLQKYIDDGLGNLLYLYNNYMNSIDLTNRPKPTIDEFKPTRKRRRYI